MENNENEQPVGTRPLDVIDVFMPFMNLVRHFRPERGTQEDPV